MDVQEHGTATERRAREVFDASVAGLDAQTRSQLNRARQEAVAATARRQGSAWGAWMPAAAIASAALVAVLLWRESSDVTAPATQARSEAEALEAVEMLAAGDDLDLATDDPAFYAWLEAGDLAPANGTG